MIDSLLGRTTGMILGLMDPFQSDIKVERKIKELINLDIIERESAHSPPPLPWVIPVAVVPKSRGEIRVCIRRETESVLLRDQHGVGMMGKCLEKLDLTSDAREIARLMTHCGLFGH